MGRTINNPKKATRIAKKLVSDWYKEHVIGIYLDAQLKETHTEIISIGSLDGSIIHPREVFRPALLYPSTGLIILHNHPSGSIKPGEEDRAITRRLKKVGKIMGIKFYDHIVFAKKGYYSFVENKDA